MAKAFRKSPQVLSLHNLDIILRTSRVTIDSMEVPGRPKNKRGICNRLKCAWLVFTGRADALTWPMDQ